MSENNIISKITIRSFLNWQGELAKVIALNAEMLRYEKEQINAFDFLLKYKLTDELIEFISLWKVSYELKSEETEACRTSLKNLLEMDSVDWLKDNQSYWDMLKTETDRIVEVGSKSVAEWDEYSQGVLDTIEANKEILTPGLNTDKEQQENE